MSDKTHRSITHRWMWHDGELVWCSPCNRPTADLVAERAGYFARQVKHPENQATDVLAELAHWYLMDRADIEAGRPPSYVPNLP